MIEHKWRVRVPHGLPGHIGVMEASEATENDFFLRINYPLIE